MAQAQAARPVGAPKVPVKRRTNGVGNWSQILNPRPDMKYVLVDASRKGMCGVDHYEMLGYKIVRKEDRPDATDLAAGARGRQKGDIVQAFGNVLMAIPLDEWESIQRYGESGNTGSELCDVIENRLRDRKQDIKEITAGTRMVSPEGEQYFHLSEDKE